jgi:hypothetical protein
MGTAQECRQFLRNKAGISMLDMLVMQYVLNDGIIMRQRHDDLDEYHIELGSKASDDEEEEEEEDGEDEDHLVASLGYYDARDFLSTSSLYTGHEDVD